MATQTPMRVLTAHDLVLLPQAAMHAEAMFGVLSDPAIYVFENEPPESVARLRDRFARLEDRSSPDGSEQWLNWVIRHGDTQLIGYVQATVRKDGDAYIAYVLSSTYWGKGLARRAVEAMIAELDENYGVRTLWAVFKARNVRSRRLLEALGFGLAPQSSYAGHGVEPDESLMIRCLTFP